MRRALVLCALVIVAALWIGCDVEDGPQDYNSDSSTWSQIGSDKMPGLTDACFLNENEGYVCGKEAFLAKTVDGADNWSIIDIPEMEDDLSIFVVHFNSSHEGFVAGRRASRFYTSDDGQTWVNQTDSSISVLDFIQYEAIDENTGYLLADDGNLWKTGNAGMSWTDLGQISTVQSMKSIFFLNENEGFAGGANSYRFKTTDGGTSWDSLAFGADDTTLSIISMWWFDDTRGIVVGERSSEKHINYYTTDGGATTAGWHEISFPGLEGTMMDINFIDDSLGYATSDDGDIYRSTDGGINWETVTSTISGPVNKINFIDASFGYHLGEDNTANAGAFKISSDQGYSWTYKSFGNRAYLQDVAFTNENIGYAVANGGYVFKTVNAGALWQHKGRPTTEHLLTVYFYDENNGWATGDNRRILKTTNGAESWTVYNGADIDRCELLDIQFLDLNNGYACGSNDVVVKTTDGGDSWTDVSPNTGFGYFDINFSDVNNGYICGERGTFAKTIDAGNSWTTYPTNTDKTLFAMDISGNSIWVAGSMCILHSPDGGTTWENFEDFLLVNYLGTSYKDIIAFSEDDVYAVGDFGYRIHTVDGGETWYRQNSPTIEEDLHSLSKAGEAVYTVGSGGTVLRLDR